MELIERQAVIDEIRKCRFVVDAIEKIRALPSAQPEIIRCKECGKREVCRTSTVWAVPPKDDWYCADAEKRREEKSMSHTHGEWLDRIRGVQEKGEEHETD